MILEVKLSYLPEETEIFVNTVIIPSLPAKSQGLDAHRQAED